MFNLPTVLQPIITSYLCPDCEADAPIVDLLVSSVGRETLDEFGHAYHARMWDQHGASYIFMPSSIIDAGRIDEFALRVRAKRGESCFEIVQQVVEEWQPQNRKTISPDIIQNLLSICAHNSIKRGIHPQTIRAGLNTFSYFLKNYDVGNASIVRKGFSEGLTAMKPVICLIGALQTYLILARQLEKDRQREFTFPPPQTVAGKAFLYRWFEPSPKPNAPPRPRRGFVDDNFQNKYLFDSHPEVRKMARSVIDICEHLSLCNTYELASQQLCTPLREALVQFSDPKMLSIYGIKEFATFLQIVEQNIRPTQTKSKKDRKSGATILEKVEIPLPSDATLCKLETALQDVTTVKESALLLYRLFYHLTLASTGTVYDTSYPGRAVRALPPDSMQTILSLYQPLDSPEETESFLDAPSAEHKMGHLDERKIEGKRELLSPGTAAAAAVAAVPANPLPPENHFYYDDRVIKYFFDLHNLESWIKAPNEVRMHTFSPRIDKYAFAGAPWARVTAWGPKQHLHLMIPGELLLSGQAPIPVVFDYTFYPDAKGGPHGVGYHRNMRIPGKKWWSTVIGPTAKHTKGKSFIPKKGDEAREEYEPATETVLITLKDHAFRIYQGGHRDV